MRSTLFIFLLFLGKVSFSQTVIKLTHEAGPMHDYHYVNPSDTTFVFVYRAEDMGQWTDPAYSIKMNYNTGKYDIPDGKYSIYINDTLDKEVFIKNKLPDSTWIQYYPDGKVHESYTFKDGKLNGEYTSYYTTGRIGSISVFKNGALDSDIQYYESGCIMVKRTRNGDALTEEKFSDTCKTKIIKKKAE